MGIAHLLATDTNLTPGSIQAPVEQVRQQTSQNMHMLLMLVLALATKW